MTVAPSGAPTSSLERDARRINDAHAGEVKPGDIAVGVIIARTSEAFDFLVYAIASVVVFPKLVFPFTDALTGTLYSFAIFSLAFVARPLGTVIFTAIDRTYGRGMKLGVALLLLGTSTVAIAFLPGYEEIGMASAYWLALFRVGQGLALGGSWDGLASLLAVNAPQNRRGYYAMIPQLGAPLGAMVASALVCVHHRQPVGSGLSRLGLALSVLRRLRHQRRGAVCALAHRRHSGIHEALCDARVAGVADPGNCSLERRHHPDRCVRASCTFRLVSHRHGVSAVVGAPVHARGSGAIPGDSSHRRGVRRRCQHRFRLDSRSDRAQSVAGGHCGRHCSRSADSRRNCWTAAKSAQMVFVLSGFALLGLAFGQASGVVAASFPMHYRYTGSALTSDLAWLFGAGFAPWVALALSSRFGLAFAGAYVAVRRARHVDRTVYQPPDRSRPRGTVMSKRLRILAILPLCAALAACDAVVLNPSGDIAAQQRDLLVTSTVLMLLIIVPVMALTVFFAWRYRHTNRKARYEPDWHHSMRLELLIWSAPLLIVICLGALTWLGTHLLDPYRPLDRIAPGQPVPEDAGRWKSTSSRSIGSGCSSTRSTVSPPSTSWRYRSISRSPCASPRPR